MYFDPKGFELFVTIIAGLAVWGLIDVVLWVSSVWWPQ